MNAHPAHGLRRTYQAGCRCLPCRAAEASYRADLRRQHATGSLPLGATMSAADTWRCIRRLKAEHISQAHIARTLGLKTPQLRWQHSVIRVRTALKLRRVFRQWSE